MFNCLNGQTVVASAGRQQRFIISVIPVVGDPVTTTPAPPVAPPAPPTVAPAPNTPQLSVGYQPETTTIQEGPAVQVRAILCGDNQVLLDVRSRVLETQAHEGGGEAPSRPLAAAKNATVVDATIVREVVAAVDRPLVSVHRVDSTLRGCWGVMCWLSA